MRYLWFPRADSEDRISLSKIRMGFFWKSFLQGENIIFFDLCSHIYLCSPAFTRFCAFLSGIANKIMTGFNCLKTKSEFWNRSFHNILWACRLEKLETEVRGEQRYILEPQIRKGKIKCNIFDKKHKKRRKISTCIRRFLHILYIREDRTNVIIRIVCNTISI